MKKPVPKSSIKYPTSSIQYPVFSIITMNKILLISIIFIFAGKALFAGEWVTLPKDKNEQKAVIEKKIQEMSFDSDSFIEEERENAHQEIYEKNNKVRKESIDLYDAYINAKFDRDEKEEKHGNIKELFDSEASKYIASEQRIKILIKQKRDQVQEVEKQIVMQQNLLIREPVGEVVTVALYQSGSHDIKRDDYNKVDHIAAEIAIGVLRKRINSTSVLKNDIIKKDSITKYESGIAESIKSSLEHHIDNETHLRISSFRIYPLKSAESGKELQFDNEKYKVAFILQKKDFEQFLTSNNISIPSSFMKRVEERIKQAAETTHDDEQVIEGILKIQGQVISRKENKLQKTINNITLETKNRKIIVEKRDKYKKGLDKALIEFKMFENKLVRAKEEYRNKKSSKHVCYFEEPIGLFNEGIRPIDTAAEVVLGSLEKMLNDRRKSYMNKRVNLEMGDDPYGQKGTADVSAVMYAFKPVYIKGDRDTKIVQVGVIFEVIMRDVVEAEDCMLTVKCNFSDAMVYIDGKQKGIIPTTGPFAIKPGKHIVKVKKDNKYTTYNEIVHLEFDSNNRNIVVNAHLEKVEPKLRWTPNKTLSKDEVKQMLKKHNFFDSRWNKGGDFKNEFVDNGDGTVTDNATGLTWEKAGSPGRMTWKDADSYAKNLVLAGPEKWRLPTIEELASLLEPRKNSDGLYIDSRFSGKQRWCRSADNNTAVSGSAWHVGFDGGYVYWEQHWHQ